MKDLLNIWNQIFELTAVLNILYEIYVGKYSLFQSNQIFGIQLFD